MEAIKKQALATFRGSLTFEENLSQLTKLMNKLTSKDVNLDMSLLHRPVSVERDGSTAPVTFIGIQENEFFSLSMFILRQGSRLPLHDHPMMHGLCKVIHGRVRIRNYTLMEDPIGCINKREIKVKREIDRIVSSEDETVVLRPKEGNIHEITAEEGPAAFVDVLAPPYFTNIPGHGPRPCNYYFRVTSDDECDEEKLVKLRQPSDYWTDEAEYQGS